MGTTAQKLEYLGTTKSQLKDMINYGLPTENQITNETTFRNYVKGIFEAFIESLRDSTTLYTNLPKISGNGTQITLNDTANAPMRITLKASELSQDGTPTPSSPQDIHTISGDNSVVVEGDNIFDKDTQNSLNAYISGSNTIALSTLDRSYWLKVNKNTTYTIKMIQKALTTSQYQDDFQCGLFAETPTIGLTGIRLFNKARSGATTDETFTETFNTDNYEYLLIKVGNTTRTNINESLDTLQLNKGTTALPYTPYVSQTAPINLGDIEYCKIGNYEDEFMIPSGNNKFNPSDLVQGYISNTLVDNRTTTCRTDMILLKAGTYYYKFKYASEVWVKLIKYANATDTNGTYIFNTKTSNYSNSFTLDSDTYVRYGFDEPLTNILTNSTIMLSTENIPYEPYNNNKWYIKKNIGKVVLDANSYFVARAEYQFYTAKYNTIIKPSSFIYSSHFPNCSGWQDNNGIFTGSTSALGLINTNTRTIEELNNWLSSNNNVTLYYILATPTYTLLNDTLQEQLDIIESKLLSYKGSTNISQVNNDLPFVISASAIKEI